MKWLKVFWDFLIRHLPRFIHVAHEVVKEMDACPDCKEDSDPCQDCDMFEDCKWYDDQVKGGE